MAAEPIDLTFLNTKSCLMNDCIFCLLRLNPEGNPVFIVA